MNVLMEIGSTNPASNNDGNGNTPIRQIMEDVLETAFEDVYYRRHNRQQ